MVRVLTLICLRQKQQKSNLRLIRLVSFEWIVCAKNVA
jgi:hypothetical protein